MNYGYFRYLAMQLFNKENIINRDDSLEKEISSCKNYC